MAHVVRISVCAILVSYFSLKTYNNAVRLLSKDTISLTSSDVQLKTHFPSIHFCPAAHITKQVMRTISSSTLAQGLQIMPEVHEIIPYLSEIHEGQEQPTNSSEQRKLWKRYWSPIALMHPGCYSYTHPKNVSVGVFNRLAFTVTLDASVYRMLMVSANEPEYFTPTANPIFGNGLAYVSPPGLNNEGSNETMVVYGYSITVADRTRLEELERNRCTNDPDEPTLDECLGQYYYRKLKCFPPSYKIPKSLLDSSNHTSLSCNELWQAEAMAKELVNGIVLDRESFLKRSNCRLPCIFREYKMEYFYTKRIPCPFKDDPERCKNSMGLYLLFTDGTVTKVREQLIYSLDDFISDVGGFLGLLLGVSIISIYDAVVTVLHKAFKGKNARLGEMRVALDNTKLVKLRSNSLPIN